MNAFILPKKLILLFIISILIVGAGLYWIIQTTRPKTNRPIEKLSIATVGDSSALVLLAKDRGYFKQNGLDVKTVQYPSGAPALKDVLQGKLDMSVGADFIGVRNSFATNNFRIIASIAKTNAFEVVARTDHGITNPSDLKGKKMGVTKGSAGEFWLGIFLTYNKLTPSDVVVVDMPPEKLTQAMVKGQIDAVLNFEPHTFNAKKQLTGKTISWFGQSGQGIYSLLYTTTNMIEKRHDVINRLVQSLIQAEGFVNSNKGEAMQFIAKNFKHDSAYMKAVIPKFSFSISLEQALILTMEDEARWMIANKLTRANKTPNYLNYVYLDALNSIRPESVTIIHNK